MQDHIIERVISKSNGEKVIKQYIKVKLLGESKEITSYEVINLQSKKSFAIKIFPKSTLYNSAKRKSQLKLEIKIQSQLSHPNVIKLHNYFEDSENFYLLFELCSNRHLKDLLRRRKRLTEIEAQCYLSQLLSGLSYLHSKKILHRDLRLEHLFLSDKLELKLGDFSHSARIEFEGERKSSICGAADFMAPEIFEGSHSYEADIWSLGVILYSMLIGKPPFHSEKSHTITRKVKAGQYAFPESPIISEASKELISRLLVVDYKKRPTIEEILDSEFFHQGYAVPKLMGLSTLAAPPAENKITSAKVAWQRRNTSPKFSEKITPNQFRANVKMQGTAFEGYGAEGQVHVKKWVDYSWKYGLGYLFSNGNCGVSFVDSTRMILNPTSTQVFYMDKSVDNKCIITEYTLNDHPEDIKKKITLLQYFKAFLEIDTDIALQKFDNNLPIYVKKYMSTRHGILFRLSNKTVQMNFTDHSELTLNCGLQIVTFANRKGERIQISISKAVKSANSEITRRLKYTRDAIKHMIKY